MYILVSFAIAYLSTELLRASSELSTLLTGAYRLA